MKEINEINIRHYSKEDREIVREISIQSSIFGEYRNVFFDDEILADLLTAYFTDYEPTSCFVAEKRGFVIGYLLGAKDTRKMYGILKGKIIPGVIKDIFLKSRFFQKKHFILIKNIVYSYLKGEFKIPDFTSKYSATLHVNIASQFRGQNVGLLLVNHFLEYLKSKKISGVHFGVLSEGAKKFFLRLNFEVLFIGRLTFLYYLTEKNLPHYVMGKKW